MNIQTGDIYRLTDAERLRMLKETQGEMLQEVPEKYADEVESILDGGDHGRANMSIHTPLVGWANKQRATVNKQRLASKKKHRIRAAKISNKRNRK
jgi:hypothetical protein